MWSCWPVVSFCDFDIATSTPISKLASRGLLITPATYSELGLRILSCSAVSGYGVNYKITWSLYVVIELNAHRHTHAHAHTHMHTHTNTHTHPHTHTPTPTSGISEKLMTAVWGCVSISSAECKRWESEGVKRLESEGEKGWDSEGVK